MKSYTKTETVTVTRTQEIVVNKPEKQVKLTKQDWASVLWRLFKRYVFSVKEMEKKNNG